MPADELMIGTCSLCRLGSFLLEGRRLERSVVHADAEKIKIFPLKKSAHA